jgi:hypothetical protein
VSPFCSIDGGVLRGLRAPASRPLLLAFAVLAIWVRLFIPGPASAAIAAELTFLCQSDRGMARTGGEAGAIGLPKVAPDCPFCRLADLPPDLPGPPIAAIASATVSVRRVGTPHPVPARLRAGRSPPARAPPGSTSHRS